MEKKIAHISVDLSPPEKSKFKSPLILVHDLWTGGWCWSQWATCFSNLGWECWAINFRGRVKGQSLEGIDRLTFDHCVEDLRRVIGAAGVAPVLVAHGMGGLAALKAGEQERISGLILLSPPYPGDMPTAGARSLGLLRLKYFLLLSLGWPIRITDRDFTHYWLSSLPTELHGEILKDLVPESSHLVRMLFQRKVPFMSVPQRYPVLVLGGTEDPVVPMESVRSTAQWLGAQCREYPGHAHWMLGEEGWQEIVNDSHRWLVQSLGEAILLEPEVPGP